jgi:hypothetical protein
LVGSNTCQDNLSQWTKNPSHECDGSVNCTKKPKTT